MDFKEIEILIEKFENGETSLDEENLLRKYFQAHSDIPLKYNAVRQYFMAIDRLRKDTVPEIYSHHFRRISNTDVILNPKPKTRNYFSLKVGIAAAILILLSVSSLLWISNPDVYNKKEKYSQEEKMLAYRQTVAALSYVSNHLNKGIEPMLSLGKLESSLETISSFEKFNNALLPISGVSKLNIVNLDYSDYR